MFTLNMCSPVFNMFSLDLDSSFLYFFSLTGACEGFTLMGMFSLEEDWSTAGMRKISYITVSRYQCLYMIIQWLVLVTWITHIPLDLWFPPTSNFQLPNDCYCLRTAYNRYMWLIKSTMITQVFQVPAEMCYHKDAEHYSTYKFNHDHSTPSNSIIITQVSQVPADLSYHTTITKNELTNHSSLSSYWRSQPT